MTKFIVALLLLSSCANKVIPNKIMTPTLTAYPTSKSVDDAWTSALQYFNDKKIAVLYANKEDGYIITGPVKVTWSTEGNTSKPDAEVMVVKDNSLTMHDTHNTVTARYKVKVSQLEGKTVLTPSIEDIKVSNEAHQSSNNSDKKIVAVAKSTGNFEKNFAGAIN